MRRILISAAILLIIISIAGCEDEGLDGGLGTNATIKEKPYSSYLEERISSETSNHTLKQDKRPDYLPEAMFSRLPEFPEDFYRIKSLVELNRITDFGALEDRYWMQPEFFPHFEDIGVPILQNPPKDRWGAYGIATYPADSVSSVVAGESLDVYFFIKSNYLVETYQGINLVTKYPESTKIQSGFEMPDGSKTVEQDPEAARKYIDVSITPNPFILEPNFPVYNVNGTRKIKVTISVSEDTPSGNYVVTLDTATVPEEYEQKWLKEYLNMYTSGGMTKIDRPYYQVFIEVGKGGGSE